MCVWFNRDVFQAAKFGRKCNGKATLPFERERRREPGMDKGMVQERPNFSKPKICAEDKNISLDQVLILGAGSNEFHKLHCRLFSWRALEM